MKILFFILICSIFLSAKVLNISDIQNYKPNDYIYYTKDNNFTYENILNNSNLSLLEKEYVNNYDGSFWTKLTIKNNTKKFEQLILYNNLAGINIIDVYLIKENQLFKEIFLGDLREQSLRNLLTRNSSFILSLEPNDEITIITKIENYLVYNLSWQITTPEKLLEKEGKVLFSFGLSGGIFLLFLIFNILNTILYKKIEYLIICFISISVFAYQYSFNGIFYFLNLNINLQFLTLIAWSATSVTVIFMLLFSIIFFNVHKNYRKFFYVSTLFIIISLLLVLLTLYSQFVDNTFFHYYGLVFLDLFIIVIYLNIFSIYMILKKELGGIYYFIGNLTLFIVVFLNSFGLLGIIDYKEIIKYLTPLAYIIDILCLLLSLNFKNKIEQRELKKAKMLLLEQSRFSSIGQAIGNISHQWRTPLTKLGTSITLLEAIHEHKIEELNETFKIKLPLIKNSIELMKKSVDEFSDFYSIKKDEDFSLLSCLENIIEILSSKIMLKKVSIKHEIPKEMTIKSYEHIWSNIFLILIDNSLDAFKEEKDRSILISLEEGKNNLKIKYIDNAGGIKIKPIESIFEYFVSYKENSNGSGIGLAVMRMLIVDKLKGSINVQNYKDGVKFEIEIPMIEIKKE